MTKPTDIEREQIVRFEALRTAHDPGVPTKEVIDRAKEYYAFLSGSA